MIYMNISEQLIVSCCSEKELKTGQGTKEWEWEGGEEEGMDACEFQRAGSALLSSQQQQKQEVS